MQGRSLRRVGVAEWVRSGNGRDGESCIPLFYRPPRREAARFPERTPLWGPFGRADYRKRAKPPAGTVTQTALP
jgi:hypothetical protein